MSVKYNFSNAGDLILHFWIEKEQKSGDTGGSTTIPLRKSFHEVKNTVSPPLGQFSGVLV